MNLPVQESPTLWPLAVYFGAVLVIVAGMIGGSYVLGQRHQERATGEPFESGIVPTGSARLRLSANFYLMAMFFVVFDVEAVFLFAWALAARQAGWPGYLEMVVFAGILLAAVIYLWRIGALDPARRQTKLPTRSQEKG
ncbi:MAG: NADH-quinone oxidoreductase subunit A [Candidatus Omnitrophica bacterium]|nr:NADH-quinone oxidoreductase subunit A [Candidatus Omnitrophota bacterium]